MPPEEAREAMGDGRWRRTRRTRRRHVAAVKTSPLDKARPTRV